MPAPKSFAATTVFSLPLGVGLLTVQANGGSVALDILHNHPNTWVAAQAAITADAVVRLEFMRGVTLRLTPTGGATCTLHEA
jgi:hypothetical protein